MEALVSGAPTASDGIARRPSPRLGSVLGVTRHDARTDAIDAIVMSGRSQGLFDAPDERRVVVVDNADALADAAFLSDVPAETAIVLVTGSRPPSRRRGRPRADEPAAVDLAGAVVASGGTVERIARLPPDDVPAWIRARAEIAGARLEPAAVTELASAAGPDTERIEQELAKLAAYAGGAPIAAATVRELVPGAIEAEVFDLTRAVVRRDARAAVTTLDRLLGDGQAPQQILALLVWQFRVLLFASRLKSDADAERAARAIRSSPGAILRWRADARRVSQADITRAYESLYATDLAIKQGRTEPEDALMFCVLDLCGVRNADPRELVVGEPPRR